MILTNNFWLISEDEMRIAFGQCDMFPCGYVSCTLPPATVAWAKNLPHPDHIAKVGYDHQHTHDGGLFNEAVLRHDIKLLVKKTNTP